MISRTYVIIYVLTTYVEQRSREIAIRHLQRVIQTPQSSSIRITDTREPTTRCRVSFEHQEGLVARLGDEAGVKVWRDECFTGSVIEVVGEFPLGVFHGSESELGSAIVIRIAGCNVSCVNCLMTSDLLFYCQCRQTVGIRRDEARIPHHLGCPATSGNGRSNEVILNRYIRIIADSLHHYAKFAKVVELAVCYWSMLMTAEAVIISTRKNDSKYID